MEFNIYKTLEFTWSMPVLVDIFFLVVLLFYTIGLFMIISENGGQHGKAVDFLGTGTVLVGLANLFEIVSQYTSVGSLYITTLSYRSLAIIGFVVVVMGFSLLIKKSRY